jgi:hypothetical protein
MRTIFSNANEDNQQERDAQAGRAEDLREGRHSDSVPWRIGGVEGKADCAES